MRNSLIREKCSYNERMERSALNWFVRVERRVKKEGQKGEMEFTKRVKKELHGTRGLSE